MVDNLEKRVAELEVWRRTVDVFIGKNDVDKEYINRRFDTLEQELKDIKATAKQLTYAVASAVIIYVVTFVMNGGLAALKG
ncbi:hypothetical protein SmphiM6_16 [Sinorhizobium phage phiM6]|nr:hypothetical protein SmphiM6_16 [Sinorhizobium phage phiM6]